MNAHWKLNRELGAMGKERGVAMPVELGRYAKDVAGSAPLEDDAELALFIARLPRVLGAVAVLNQENRLATLLNVARANYASDQTMRANLFATVRTGLTTPSAVLVRPFDGEAETEQGAEIFVRRNELDTVQYVFGLTEEGQDVMRVQEAVFAQQTADLAVKTTLPREF